MSRVRIASSAKCDLIEAKKWYRKLDPELAKAFLKDYQRRIALIKSNPEIFGSVAEDVRACRMMRFPYVIYYRHFDNSVEVFAVLHGSRDASAWKRRLTE